MSRTSPILHYRCRFLGGRICIMYMIVIVPRDQYVDSEVVLEAIYEVWT